MNAIDKIKFFLKAVWSKILVYKKKTSKDGDRLNLTVGNVFKQGRPVSKPYVISITNSTDGEKKAILFGWNKYFDATNYGSDEGVSVTSAIPNTEYKHLLNQSAFKPFSSNLLRFTSLSIEQLDQIIQMEYMDANGRFTSDPINLSDHKDPYQFQNGIVDVACHVNINLNTYIVIPILPKTSLNVIVSPSEIPQP